MGDTNGYLGTWGVVVFAGGAVGGSFLRASYLAFSFSAFLLMSL
jgi:hypothetical protein